MCGGHGWLVDASEHGVLQRPCAEALREEGLKVVELLAGRLLGLRRHFAHQHEDRFIAVIHYVRQ